MIRVNVPNGVHRGGSTIGKIIFILVINLVIILNIIHHHGDQDHHDQGDSTSDPMECIAEEVNNKEAFPVIGAIVVIITITIKINCVKTQTKFK